jgi:hypothetical protein
MFLDLADQVFDRFQPETLLTYSGHPASRELMRHLLSVVRGPWSVVKYVRLRGGGW